MAVILYLIITLGLGIVALAITFAVFYFLAILISDLLDKFHR
jgi:hypothetical protein